MCDGYICNNGNIELNKIKVGAIWYPPIINKLKNYIDNNSIRTHAEGKCNITFCIDSKNEAIFQSNPPGIK